MIICLMGHKPMPVGWHVLTCHGRCKFSLRIVFTHRDDIISNNNNKNKIFLKTQGKGSHVGLLIDSLVVLHLWSHHLHKH